MPESGNLGQLKTQEWQHLQDLADQLEHALTEVDSVDLSRFLPPPGSPQRLVFLHELIKTEMEIRCRRRKTVSLDEYLQRYPELGSADIAARRTDLRGISRPPSLRRQAAARHSTGSVSPPSSSSCKAGENRPGGDESTIPSCRNGAAAGIGAPIRTRTRSRLPDTLRRNAAARRRRCRRSCRRDRFAPTRA